jgi:hypothetical protein
MKQLILTLIFAAGLFAADPTGNWKAAVDGPDGSKTELVFQFQMQPGGSLTGTIQSAMGEMHIVEGKVEGDNISFIAEFGDFRIPHKGTIAGGEMKLESTMMEQKFNLVLKKS